MRAAAARAPRNPSKHTVISTISSYDFNKTYENIRLSHPRIMKICQPAQAESFKNHWFFNIPVQRGFAGNFRAHLELLRPRSQSHHPCQIIPCGPHARVRRASMSKSLKNNLFLKGSASAREQKFQNCSMRTRCVFMRFIEVRCWNCCKTQNF